MGVNSSISTYFKLNYFQEICCHEQQFHTNLKYFRKKEQSEFMLMLLPESFSDHRKQNARLIKPLILLSVFLVNN